MITAPSCSGEPGMKIVSINSGDTFASIARPLATNSLKPSFLLEHHQRADPPRGQPCGRSRHFLGTLARWTRAAEERLRADAGQRAANVGLENHDQDDDQANRGNC